MTQLVEEAQRNAQTTRTMARYRERMFHALVSRALTVADRLGAEAPAFSVEGNADEAGYISFFERFLAKLEETVTSLDDLVEAESRNLLCFATRRILTNLRRLMPSLDLETVTVPINLNSREALSDAVWRTAEAYTKLFRKVEVEKEDDDGEEDSEDEDEEAAASQDNNGPAA